MTTQPTNKTLKIPNKAKNTASGTVKQADYGTDMRTIENWANNQPGGSIASLSGSGLTNSPGTLVQSGPFEVIDTSSGEQAVAIGGGGIVMESTGPSGITIEDESTAGLSLVEAGTGGLGLDSQGGGFIDITSDTGGQAIQVITASTTAALDTPTATPAFGFTADGHISFYPSGGPWATLI